MQQLIAIEAVNKLNFAAKTMSSLMNEIELTLMT
jgi:hypothetical protein